MLRKLIGKGLIALMVCGTIAAFADVEQPQTNLQTNQSENIEIWITDEYIQNEKLMEYFWRPYRFEPDLFGIHKWYYDSSMPNALSVDLQYNQYPLARHFGVALHEGVYIRSQPKFSSTILSKRPIYTKLDILGVVHGEMVKKMKSDEWYEVSYTVNGETRTGYVFSGYMEKREFNYEGMLERAMALSSKLSGATVGHINNYKNRNGKPPLYQKTDRDAFGYNRDQSAPAYFKADITSDFRYFSDGRMIIIKEDLGEFYACEHPFFEGTYYVPKKYVVVEAVQKPYSQFLIVDRTNQTELALEKRGTEWFLVTQNLVTTGLAAQYKEETELGYFQIIEKKSKFIYLDDVTKEVDGYAPYALRFNGGAYTHGVPVNFRKVIEKILVKPEVIDAFGVVIQAAVYKDKVKELVDPGLVEYLSTIGTTPRSHKCVRHHTSSALFLYNWVRIGEAAMIVMD